MTSLPRSSLPQRRPLKFRALRTISALFIREMSTTYGRSAGGYLWAIAEPVAALILMSLVFSLALRAPSLGTNFALFYASGFLPFIGFMDVSQKVSTALRFSKQLLAYPGVTFIDALIARLFLNMLTQIMIFIVVVPSLIIAFNVDVILSIPQIALGMAMAFWLAAGVGTLNCYLLTRFPVWERVWSIITRPLFFISGVFFIFDDIPQPFQDWLWYNPLVHIVGVVRRGIYTTYDGSYVSIVYVFFIGGVTLVAGLLLLRRYYREILIL